VHDFAVLAQVAVLEMRVGLPGHDPAGGLQGAFQIVRVDEFDQFAPQHFVRGVAEDLLACRADKHEATLRIHHADGIQQQIHEGGGG